MNGSNRGGMGTAFRFLGTRRAVLELAAALGLGRYLPGADPAAAKTPMAPAPRSTTAGHRTDNGSRSAQEGDTVQLTITHVNPEAMHNNPAFSQAVVIEGAAKTIYVGGQNAVDAAGQIVGAGDLAAQTEQTLKNVETVLAASGAGRDDIVKWTILVVQGQDINAGFGAFQRVWGPSARPPVITFAFVAGLANPEFLVEIEAIAVAGAGRD